MNVFDSTSRRRASTHVNACQRASTRVDVPPYLALAGCYPREATVYRKRTLLSVGPGRKVIGQQSVKRDLLRTVYT